MNFKKRVNGSWVDTPNYIHNTSTDTITTLPAVIHPTGTTATVGLKGNTLQSSIPSPTSPVMPQGTGERTENLLNLSSYSGTPAGISDIVINGNSITFNASSQFLAIVYEFNLGISDVYTLALGGESFHTRLEIRYIKDGVIVGSAIVIQPNRNATIGGSEEYNGFRVYISNANNTGTCTASNIMLNTGSTPLPYEPYGYKISISSANSTTPVYLGVAESTRQIKKMVLTGEEAIEIKSGNAKWYIPIADMKTPTNTSVIEWYCSHYQAVANSASWTSYDYMISWSTADSGTSIGLRIRDIDFLTEVTVSDFKTYLQQQYAAGTPVTVWYVLANEETAVVNEPLMRIGDYADEVSGITIPTIAGANTLSVDTTLQPSEVSVNYKGWHPVADVHEYDSNYTIATMQALTIAQLQSHTIGDLEGGGWS